MANLWLAIQSDAEVSCVDGIRKAVFLCAGMRNSEDLLATRAILEQSHEDECITDVVRSECRPEGPSGCHGIYCTIEHNLLRMS
jgi:hypothetical protein